MGVTGWGLGGEKAIKKRRGGGGQKTEVASNYKGRGGGRRWEKGTEPNWERDVLMDGAGILMSECMKGT